MTSKPGLAEALRKARREPKRQAKASEFDDAIPWLEQLAKLSGVDPSKFVKELRANTALAIFTRRLFGVARPKERRGKKPDDQANWHVFVALELAKRTGTLEETLERYSAHVDGDTQERRREALKQAHKRASKQWTPEQVPSKVSDLFSGPPPKRPTK